MRYALFAGMFFVATVLTSPGSFDQAHAETFMREEKSQLLVPHLTSSDPQWEQMDDQQITYVAESGSSAPSQPWYERPSTVQQRPADEPVSQQGTQQAPARPWYQQQLPAATGAPPAARQPHVSVPVETRDIGGGRSGGVLPDMPQRGMPGRDMGPAGAAKQPPSGMPFDRGVGPGSVMSGGRTERTLDDGTVVTNWRSDEGDYYVVKDDPDGTRTISVFRADGTSDTHVYEPITPSDGSFEGITLAPIPPDSEDESEEGQGETAESRPGDPDQWYGESPPNRTGVGSTLRDRKPARDGRVGGKDGQERESAHAPRPELDVEQQATDKAGQVGDRRERGPGFQILLPENRLGDPPRGGAGTN